MPDTSLSPRLRHLLIQEDRQTGQLIMPGRSSIRSSLSEGMSPGSLSTSLPTGGVSFGSRNTSPAVSPTSNAFTPSPYEKHRPLPLSLNQAKYGMEDSRSRLPPPTSSARSTSSIFSLLNINRNPTSPPSTSSSSGSMRAEQERTRYGGGEKDKERERDRRRATPPYPTTRPRVSSVHQPPLSAPITSDSQSMYFDERSAFPPGPSLYPPATSQGEPGREYSSSVARPGLLRRHSSHPYESSASPRPTTAYATGPIFDAEYAAMGARAPISRTTKACNACRSRKVRCDAGGGDMGPCSRCRESGVQCVYTGVQKKRGPCPGTARPSISKPRRPSTHSQHPPSHRNSVASINSVQSYVVTPPDEQAYTSRTSYGFPALPAPPPHVQGYHGMAPAVAPSHPPADPAEWSSVAPGAAKHRPGTASGPGYSHLTPGYGPHTPGIERQATGSVGPHHGQSPAGAPGPAVLSWPAMQPAIEVVDRGVFQQDYDMGVRPKSASRGILSARSSPVGGTAPPPVIASNEPRTLPPLRVAINRGPYYENRG
ncbi:hypothetical protein IAU60_005618 [Kwoniella sp. DSM 27419]